jgi:hypothetical protein
VNDRTCSEKRERGPSIGWHCCQTRLGVSAESDNLCNRATFQEDRLFQGTEELLVGKEVLNGAWVKLGTGSYDVASSY